MAQGCHFVAQASACAVRLKEIIFQDWKYSSAGDFCDSVKFEGIIELNYTN